VETRGRCKAAEDALLAHPDAHHDVLTEIVGVTSGHTEVGNDAVRGGKKDARGGFDVGVDELEQIADGGAAGAALPCRASPCCAVAIPGHLAVPRETEQVGPHVNDARTPGQSRTCLSTLKKSKSRTDLSGSQNACRRAKRAVASLQLDDPGLLALVVGL